MSKIKVKVREDQYDRSARITPVGFWAEAVTVHQDHAFASEDWREPEISWSCGGVEQGTNSLDASENLIEALKLAQKIYLLWKEDKSAMCYATPKES